MGPFRSGRGCQMQRRFLLMSLWVVLVACGGSSSPPPASEPTQCAASAGAETPGEEASSEPEEAAPAAAASPATLKVVAKVGGKPVAAHVKVFDESGALLAEGASDKPLAVRSGELTMEVAVKDSKELRGGETIQ